MAREYKDSGIEWIGRIPKDWKTERIKSLFSERNERDCQGKTLLSVSQYYGIRPKSETDLANSHIAESYDDYKEVHKGDFVMNIMLAWNGSYAVSDYDGIVSPAYCVFKFRKDYCKKYFHYLLRTDGYPAAFKTMSRGVIDSRLRLYPEQFYTFPVVIPPLAEQQRIASYLDKKCAEIDSLVELQEQMIAQLTDYKQSVITEAVTKGLNPSAEMKDSGIKWVGEMPLHWECVKGKYLLRYLQKPVKKDDGVITCFRDGEVTLRSKRREEGFTFADKEIGYQGIDVGDLVVHGMDGFAGAIGISDARGKASPVLNVLDTQQNKKYIMYYLRSMAYGDVFMALSTGIRVRSCDLRWNKLAELLYPVPPIEEQNAIVTFIDTTLQKTNSLIAAKQSQIETLEAYKKSIIYEYVTGKKEVG